MSVTLVSGATLSADLTKAYIEAGVIEFLGQTTLKVVSDTAWCVWADVVVSNYPLGADNPGVLAVEVKDLVTGTFIAGGGRVNEGGPTPATGVTFTTDVRVVLDRFGDGKIGTYQFTVSYNIGASCP